MNAFVERRTFKELHLLDSGSVHAANERSQHAERRLPMTEESVLSDAEFECYFGRTDKHPNTNGLILSPATGAFCRMQEDY